MIPPREPATAGNENTGLLKAIALVCMIVDHVGFVFLPQCREMRVIGRIAFPLFAWCAVVGCCHTRNIWRYALRLLVAAILSQPFFLLALPQEELNVIFTLTLSVLAVAGIREKRWGSQMWAPALALLFSCAVKTEYGWKGVLLILILYGCRRSRSALAAGMTAFCLFWAQGTFTVTSFLGVPAVLSLPFLPETGNLLTTVAMAQFWGILALPLILLPMKERLPLSKWVFYLAYPGHLLILALLRWGSGIGERLMHLL